VVAGDDAVTGGLDGSALALVWRYMAAVRGDHVFAMHRL